MMLEYWEMGPAMKKEFFSNSRDLRQMCGSEEGEECEDWNRRMDCVKVKKTIFYDMNHNLHWAMV